MPATVYAAAARGVGGGLWWIPPCSFQSACGITRLVPPVSLERTLALTSDERDPRRPGEDDHVARDRIVLDLEQPARAERECDPVPHR